MKRNIAFFGAGAYAESLAQTMATKHPRGSDNPVEVTLWTHQSGYRDVAGQWRHAEEVRPDNARITASASECVEDADAIFVATRTSEMARVLSNHFGRFDLRGLPLISCCKGVNGHRHQLPLEIVGDTLQSNEKDQGVFAGPGYADQIMRGEDATVVIAGQEHVQELVLDLLGTEHLQILPSSDRVGLQLCALKNVEVILLAIVEKLQGLGSVLWRDVFYQSLQEMGDLVAAYGGLEETVRGPAGVGDLVLTSTMGNSRNRSYGKGIADGKYDPGEMTVEGRGSSRGFVELAKARNVDLPVASLVAELVRMERVMTPKDLLQCVEQCL